MGLYPQAIQLDRWDGDPGDPRSIVCSRRSPREERAPARARAAREQSAADPRAAGADPRAGRRGLRGIVVDRIFPPSSHNAQVANADLT